MDTCGRCGQPYDGIPFGPRWSDEWCMSCWFAAPEEDEKAAVETILDGAALEDEVLAQTSAAALEELERRTKALEGDLHDKEFEIDELEAEAHDIRDELRRIEEAEQKLRDLQRKPRRKVLR